MAKRELLLGVKDIKCDTDIPETADTLEGNALLKAKYIFDNYHLDCFADDTGLEVATLVVLPLSTAQKNHLPTHIHIKGSKALPKDSIVLAEQIRTIDRYRLKNYVGSVDLELMEKVEKAMKISIGVDFDD